MSTIADFSKSTKSSADGMLIHFLEIWKPWLGENTWLGATDTEDRRTAFAPPVRQSSFNSKGERTPDSLRFAEQSTYNHDRNGVTGTSIGSSTKVEGSWLWIISIATIGDCYGTLCCRH